MNSITHALYYYQFRQLVLGLLISFSIISCVTINIYFPAAAAEEAAEKIVDEILNTNHLNTDEVKPELNQSTDQTLNPAQRDARIDSQRNAQSFINTPIIESSLVSVINFFIPAAQAGQANISIDSAKIRSIRNKMKQRQAKLNPFYKSGNIGFTNKGFIASVSDKGLSIKQKSTAKKLINAENNDRKALYREIANANGHPEWQNDIQKTFAQTWISKIPSGWMYQTSAGQWKKK